MDIEKYISSGILELYVYGALSEEESREVTRVLKEYPEVRKEVEEIEAALTKLAISTAPYNPEHLLATLKEKLRNSNNNTTVTHPAASKERTPWFSYIGWAASILLLVGLFFLFNENNELRTSLREQKVKNARMEQQIADAREDAEKTKELLAVLRDKEVNRIPLKGQNVAPEAYAQVYWNEKEQKAYIDAQGLPEPPRGKVYQVWSLTMQPLTPTSIGLLEDFEKDENKVFSLENANKSEAFGITLEPEGGSESPTMDQLYVLGTVASL
ncbi:anti-sigma factor [Salegentibacter chungangensis]|uniref:Regulator of SigK n=1 Tax=Salegentibacter chungangensis TaxID=1335724 RepID=A0ABW3NRT6_9FLAO